MKAVLRKVKYFFVRLKYSKKNIIGSYFTIGKQVKLDNCQLKYHARVAEYASLSNTTIGEYSSIGRYTKIVYTNIGKYCAISWDTTINAISHPHTHLSVSAFPYVPHVGEFVEKREQSYQNVIIKNDVWIGAHCVIMPGVTLGNGAIIGAGAVVTKDVPDYAIVAGVPAKIMKYRFPVDVIEQLLKYKWWDLDPSIIKNNITLWQGNMNTDTLRKLKKLCES